MLANNDWERPIYFSTTVGRGDYLGMGNHLQMEGLALRVLPVPFNNKEGWVNTDIMYQRLVVDTYWEGLDDETRFFNENYLRFPSNSRNKFHRLADALFRKGDKEKAKEVIEFCLEKMPDSAIPYDYNIPGFVDLLFKLEEKERAEEMASLLVDRAKNTLEYYGRKKDTGTDGEQLKRMALYTLDSMRRAYQMNGMKEKADAAETVLRTYM